MRAEAYKCVRLPIFCILACAAALRCIYAYIQLPYLNTRGGAAVRKNARIGRDAHKRNHSQITARLKYSNTR
mgnify:CR=1 FL=1